MPRILIIDESSESREVLAALAARCGATTIEARRPDQAAQLADLHQVDLIVFDADGDRSTRGTAIAELAAFAGRKGTPIIILGTVRIPPDRPLGGQFVSKPYHYGPLVHRIEELLAAA